MLDQVDDRRGVGHGSARFFGRCVTDGVVGAAAALEQRAEHTTSLWVEAAVSNENTRYRSHHTRVFGPDLPNRQQRRLGGVERSEVGAGDGLGGEAVLGEKLRRGELLGSSE